MNNEIIEIKEATEVVAENYVELSKYTTRTRTYASAVDGMKAVFRRVIYAARNYNHLVKSAVIVGDTLKYHPHGDSSVYDVLVQMACKFGQFPLFLSKGNFGGLGYSYAAMRYTEACLSDIARLMYLELIDYAEYIDGEAGYPEPVYLPALIPYCLLVGTSAIPVGMPAPAIYPVNSLDLIKYYIDILQKNPNPKLPMIDLGEIAINNDRESVEWILKEGKGRVSIEGIVIQEDWNKFVVNCETPKCNFWKLYCKVSHWIDKEEVDYIDETDDNGSRHVYIATKIEPNELKEALERALRGSISYNIVTENREIAVPCGIEYIIDRNLKYLRECTIRKYKDKLSKDKSRMLVLEAIEAFKETGRVEELPILESSEVISIIEGLGFENWVAKEVLNKSIKHLTKSHELEIIELEASFKVYQSFIDNPDSYLVTLYQELYNKVKPFYDSRSHSILVSEKSDSTLKLAKLDESGNAIVVNESEGIKWNRNVFLISNDGTVTSRYLSPHQASSTIDVSSEGRQYFKIASDKFKYILLVVGGNNIVVLTTDQLAGSKQRFKSWEGLTIDKVFYTNNSEILLIDERGKSEEVDISKFWRSRVAAPVRASRYNIKEIVDLASES